MYRDVQVMIIMGCNGIGKSFLIEKIVKVMKRCVIVIMFNGVLKIW